MPRPLCPRERTPVPIEWEAKIPANKYKITPKSIKCDIQFIVINYKITLKA
jgi:hypothetical protein